jgi:Zn-dependent metalloprotease
MTGLYVPRHKCTCHFVTPHALEGAARAGVDEARVALLSGSQARAKRASMIEKLDVKQFATAIAGTTTAGNKGAREVYDSNNTRKQRKKLVRKEGDTAASGDPAVDEVFESAKIVRDYYKKKLGRNSIDDKGLKLILNVHYGTKYMNAFWDGDEMTFGDGDGDIFVSFTKSIDVIAHELAHGVTQFTAGLEYFSQSGALNEHFSDVFGSAIQQYALGQDAGQADWLIGDEIMGPTLFGESLRYMGEPGTAYDNKLLGKDPQPAHMKDYFAGPEDNQGVHINSGIPNKAFYLVAMAIGTDDAALIWYEGLKKLWPTARFNDAVNALVQAAQELQRDKKVRPAATQTVRSAFREVGLPAA